MGETTRECPYCQEPINVEAIKCRWCGEMLPDGPRAGDRAPGMVQGAGRAVQPPEGAGMILAFGILSWLVCFLFGIFAWVKGNEYERECRALGVAPEGTATAGRILGMISVILAIVGVGIGVILVAVMVAGGAAAAS